MMYLLLLAVTVRTFDGVYNHPERPTCGMAGSPMIRLTGTDTTYVDAGVGQMPVSGLPSARAVSEAQFSEAVEAVVSSTRSTWFAFFAQLVAHDVVDTSTPARPPDIQAIPVPADDPVFAAAIDALPMYRSAAAPGTGVLSANAPRVPVNAATPFLDLDPVYGRTAARNAVLREADGTGRMRVLPPNAVGAPMLNPVPFRDLTTGLVQGHVAGAETLDRITMTTIWTLRHNVHADALPGEKFPGDEDRFQEARRRTIADYQAIVYAEFLPLFLGLPVPDAAAAPADVDPQVTVEFAHALRYGHTLIPPGTRDRFFPSSVPGLEDVLARARVMLTERAGADDGRYATDVQDTLYGVDLAASQRDLAALDVHRARDHGIPTLGVVRTALGLDPGPNAEAEFFVGGMAEGEGTGAMGETFARILAEGFARIRAGDRLFNATTPPVSMLDVLGSVGVDVGGLATAFDSASVDPASSSSAATTASSTSLFPAAGVQIGVTVAVVGVAAIVAVVGTLWWPTRKATPSPSSSSSRRPRKLRYRSPADAVYNNLGRLPDVGARLSSMTARQFAKYYADVVRSFTPPPGPALEARARRRRLQNRYLYVFLGALTLLVFAERFYVYAFEREHTGMRAATRNGVPVTRGAASVIALGMAMAIVTKAHYVLSLPKMPAVIADHAYAVHTFFGWVYIVGSAVHVGGHMSNFYFLSAAEGSVLAGLFPEMAVASNTVPSFLGFWALTVTGFTGVVLTLLSLAMLPAAVFARVRRASYVLFWRAHMLWSVIVVVSMIHGGAQLVQAPLVWHATILPLTVFMVDRLIRLRTSVRPVRVLASRFNPTTEILHLDLEKPEGFKFRPGQWAYVCALGEKHPFSISSAPSEKSVSFHVKVSEFDDAWTRRMVKTTVDVVHIDGAFGRGIGDRFGGPDSRVIILCAGGIGATPFLSVLKELGLRSAWSASRRVDSLGVSDLRRIYFVWSFRAENDIRNVRRHTQWIEDAVQGVVEAYRLRDKFNMYRYITTGSDFDEVSLAAFPLRVQALDLPGQTFLARPDFVQMASVIRRDNRTVTDREIDVYICGSPAYTDAAASGFAAVFPRADIVCESF